MQSDDLDRTSELFSAATAAFRSAVTDAIEQVRAYRDAHARPAGSPASRAAAELGSFAADHIDEERFAALFASDSALDTDTLRLLDRTLAVLRELSNREGPAFRVEVGPGGDVAAAVGSALASIGRVFGAARVAELVRLGHLDLARNEDAAAPFPFVRWTAANRRMGPALIVTCAGADLDAIELAPFLDGTQKIALFVEGATPAAALSRLITPGTFVMQTLDPAEVARLAAFNGPGIAAVVPEGCALFTHDPAASRSERLTVVARPEGRPRNLRRASAFQQAEAVAVLDLMERALHAVDAGAAPPAAGEAMAALAATVPAGVGNGASPASEPVDALAAWLLAQAGLAPSGEAAGR